MPSETVHFDDELYTQLKKLCKGKKCNFSTLVRDLIRIPVQLELTTIAKSSEPILKVTK